MPPGQSLRFREREVPLLIAEDCTFREIGCRLQISPDTVEVVRTILLHKSRAKNSVRRVLKAQARG
jgi:DNA-binding CsgD family transcriptional regulator